MRLPQDRIPHIGAELKDGKVNIVAEWQGELVRCKDCKFEFICKQTVEQVNEDDVEHRPLEWCSYGARREE